MNDDFADFKPLDPGRVNALDSFELEYWCKEFKCTMVELTDAVSRVGEHVAEVRQAVTLHRSHTPS